MLQKVIAGLGKTGMSCVRYLSQFKEKIAIVDNRECPPYIEELKTKFPEIPLSLGKLDPFYLNQAREIIVSPGIPLTEEALINAQKNGAIIIGDIELFAQAAHAPIAAITGSNGKSTVTTLLGEMAKKAQLSVKVGGNLGIPALDLLDKQAELYVLELSSFQLETTNSLKADAAVVLNITPDHMDRYQTLDEYRDAKQRIYAHSKIAIINRNDPYSYTHAPLPNKIISFGLDKPEAHNFGYANGYLLHGEKKLLASSELKIKGQHQIANALAALALGSALNLPMTAMLNALREFPGLAHRCQWIIKHKKVDWYNDSKGTNVGATKAAIDGLGAEINGKIILIAGGIGKDADFSPLRESAIKYVRTVILIGKDAQKISAALKSDVDKTLAKDMQDAVKIAYLKAKEGDAVLLSPACASFDMFNNFEHRGDVFIAAIQEILCP